MKFKNHVIVLFVVISFSVMAGCFDSGGSDGSDDGGQTEVEHTETYTVADGQTVSENDIVRLVNGEIETAKMNTEIEVDDAFEEFASHACFISASPITSEKVIIAYYDFNNGNAIGRVSVLSISGNTVTAGTPVTFNDYSTQATSIAVVSSNKAIVSYWDNGNTGYIKARALSISGNDITMGDPIVVNTGYTYRDFAICALTENEALIVYTKEPETLNSYGFARVLSIPQDGYSLTLEPESPVVFSYDRTSYLSVSALSEGKAIVIYSIVADNSQYCKARLIERTSDGISLSTPALVDDTENMYARGNPPVAALTENKVIVLYKNSTGDHFARILTIDENSILQGPGIQLTNGSWLDELSVSAFNSNKAIITYRSNDGAPHPGIAQNLLISDNSIIPGGTIIFESERADSNMLCTLSANKCIVAYQHFDSRKGHVKIITSYSDYGDIIGISKENKPSGELCQVAEFGNSTHIYDLSELIAGDTYYIDVNGNLTTIPNYVPPQPVNQIFTSIKNYIVGVAEDESTIEVTGEYSN
ncbi:MAG: hypothetical protein ACOCWZ_08340 [Spirochaetota bacterium]